MPTTPFRHTVRLPLGILVDDFWKEIGLVEVPVTIHVDTVQPATAYAALNPAQSRVLPAGACGACGLDLRVGDELQMTPDGIEHFHCPRAEDRETPDRQLEDVVEYGPRWSRRPKCWQCGQTIEDGQNALVAFDGTQQQHAECPKETATQTALVDTGVDAVFEPPAKKCHRCGMVLRPGQDAIRRRADGNLVHNNCPTVKEKKRG